MEPQAQALAYCIAEGIPGEHLAAATSKLGAIRVLHLADGHRLWDSFSDPQVMLSTGVFAAITHKFCYAHSPKWGQFSGTWASEHTRLTYHVDDVMIICATRGQHVDSLLPAGQIL